jgi:hypothetical protein
VAGVPTQAATLTGQGVIVGTLQYMAPEQLEGKPPDARTDLWALGAILYEMVTGKRAFEGTSAVSLMAAILDHEPPSIASLQPLTPPALDRLVRDCLAKLPDDRPDTAHDLAKELRWLRQLSSLGQSVGVKRAAGARVTLLVASLVVAAATAGAAITFLLRPTPSPAPRLAARLSLDGQASANVRDRHFGVTADRDFPRSSVNVRECPRAIPVPSA